MRIAVLAVGRMKAGPESELLERYVERARATGRPLGISGIEIREFAESRARTVQLRCAEEAQALLAASAQRNALVCLDERGSDMTSEAFAALLQAHLADGTRELAFAIGGPDGHDGSLRAAASRVIRFGAATWPHQIVRVLLSEQIYRACTILSGHPYHRA
jgi:23S rRNA (pseudouridine1915-N3)-methyltransferase